VDVRDGMDRRIGTAAAGCGPGISSRAV